MTSIATKTDRKDAKQGTEVLVSIDDGQSWRGPSVHRMLVPEARRFRAELDAAIKAAEVANRPGGTRMGDYGR